MIFTNTLITNGRHRLSELSFPKLHKRKPVSVSFCHKCAKSHMSLHLMLHRALYNDLGQDVSVGNYWNGMYHMHHSYGNDNSSHVVLL